MTEGQACHSPRHPGASRQTGRWPELALASPDKINGSGAGHAGAERGGLRGQAGGGNNTGSSTSAESLVPVWI